MHEPTYNFDCGCKFKMYSEERKEIDNLPPMSMDYYNLRHCPATWDLMSTGNTKGVFQLESKLGRDWCGSIQPFNLEELAALVSLIRPGCISGDTQIKCRFYPKDNDKNCVSFTMKEIYEKFHRNANSYQADILSVDENNTIVKNKIINVMHNGKKDIYKVNLNSRKRNKCNNSYYNVECTLDHKFLVFRDFQKQWVELENIHPGERIAVLSVSKKISKHTKNSAGEKNFREICFKNYEYKCVFCDWNDGSLDVNHLNGNRKTNNNPDNLCFMCPNHHRMYSEGNITEHLTRLSRDKYKLPVSDDIEWAEFVDYEFVKNDNVYDISCEAPNHNFIAGNVVVHNCLNSILDGKSLTTHYKDRKKGEEETTYISPALENILDSTYGILTFQEQSMRIAQELAGFDLKDADILRKAIGKKDAESMTKVYTQFMEGCDRVGILTKSEAEEVFGWIREGQRYLFNKSHAIGYGDIGYWTCYAKQHFPLHFFTSYLYYAKFKQDPQTEVEELVGDAKLFNVNIFPPSVETLFLGDRGEFGMSTNGVHFGISNIKGIGRKHVEKFMVVIREQEALVGKKIAQFNWFEFLTAISPLINKTIVNNLISVGGLDLYTETRASMLYQYQIFQKLSPKERKFVIDNARNLGSLKEALTALSLTPRAQGGPANYKRVDIVKDLVEILEKPSYNLDDKPQWIVNTENNLLGVSLSSSSLDGCSSYIANATCKEFIDGRPGKMSLAVEIKGVNEFVIKRGASKGKRMAFIVVEDDTARTDSVCCFAEKWEKYKNTIYKGNTLLLSGQVSKQKKLFIINDIHEL